MKTSLSACTNEFSKLIKSSKYTDRNGILCSLEQGTCDALDLLHLTKKSGGNVYLVGNGGSAAVASHITNDLCNVAGMRVMSLHEPSVLTCFSNDYGYEHAFAMQLEKMARKDDLLIAISSSGSSKNIINAAISMHAISGKVITLTGFSKDNPLRVLGDLNYWVNSSEYGFVEIAHLFTLHHWSDRIGAVWAEKIKMFSIAN